MNKHLILAFCCVTASTVFVQANHELAEQALKAAIVKMILNNNTHFDEPTVAKAKQHKSDPRTFKQILTALTEEKKNPAVLAALAKNAQLQKAASIIENIISPEEATRTSLEKQMKGYDDSMVEVFINMQVLSKKFNADEILALEQALEIQAEASQA